MILIKSDHEIALMRDAGKILAEVLMGMNERIVPGVTTQELDDWADSRIAAAGCVATFRGQPGMVRGARPFPAATCISINEEIIHGIPSKQRVIKDGDIVSVDCGVTYKGYVADSAFSRIAGSGSPDLVRLLETTKRSLYAGIEKARPGGRLGDISFAVESWAVAEGLGIVRDFCGHGVGRSLHEDPGIPNYGKPGTGPLLRQGMTLAIEPMFMLGKEKVKVLVDGWTVVTSDRSPAAHWEHTILITDNGPEILTKWAQV
ncbi:MAG TPA: type I methionyl aminopeptidase [Myxococcota bacterium]|nr:type I methionyl aminopeptidase [Myxococcota bacterium]HOD00664.1 type I methionyl aminopeptidase [Myxococcota bacterium]HOH76813.1 type I methionyl aminopeptidase [Myxococcota bacterium]HPV05234.1 type I methionyl aminopeptidase [Myxococcota bacterium]